MLKRAGLIAIALAVSGCNENAGPETSPGAGGSLAQQSAPPPPVHIPSPSERPRQAAQYRAPAQYHAPRNAVPRAWSPSAPRRAWQYIVIHHSDTDTGSAASFRRYHVEQRHWSDLGYHFVIGNGQGAGNGAVEVGGRWTRQETGAHAGVLKFNEWGIGICLVGDFNRARPTQAQMQSLAQLTAYLMRAYRIPAERVISHNQAKEGRTQCPGRHFSMPSLRTMASRMAHADDPAFPVFEHLAHGELLRDVSHQ